jgi:hypothetical protein
MEIIDRKSAGGGDEVIYDIPEKKPKSKKLTEEVLTVDTFFARNKAILAKCQLALDFKEEGKK